jgi:hypothetical protein
MTTQPEQFGKALAQLLKGVFSLLVIGVLAYACLHGGGTHTSTRPTTTPPPSGAQKSTVFSNIWVPPGAHLYSSEGAGEWWEIDIPYPDAVAQEEALLPVGKWLDSYPGYPWCRKRIDTSGSSQGTSWFWGDLKDAVVVAVWQEDDHARIMTARASCDRTYTQTNGETP